MEYQATYRRSEVAIPALLGVLVLLAAGIAFALRAPDGNATLSIVLWVLGASVAAVLVILANAFRVHRWTIAPDGLQVAERPKVPLAGLRRRATVGFGEIAAVYRIESGLDRVVDVVTTRGQRYRLTQALAKDSAGIPRPDPDANLEAFIASLRDAARAAGVILPEPSEGLSFWNTLAGLAVLIVALGVAVVFAGAAGWTLFNGGFEPGQRGSYGAALALLLPFGAAHLTMKSLRRRRLVLAQRNSA